LNTHANSTILSFEALRDFIAAALSSQGLPPADARAAFERGSVDAWVVWDPFLAAVQKQASVRVLTDGRHLASYQRYYLAGTAYAQARPDVLRVFFSELQKAGVWVKQHPKEAAALLGPVWGLDAEIVELANSRRSYEVRAVQPSNMGEQQRIADAFLSEKLLPRRVDALNAPLFKPGA